MRASEAPEQWKEVLDALNKEDFKLANKLAVKYNFASRTSDDTLEDELDDIRFVPLKCDYVAMDPKGVMYCHDSASVLSKYLGLSKSYVGVAVRRFARYGGYSVSGKMKGWKFWRE